MATLVALIVICFAFSFIGKDAAISIVRRGLFESKVRDAIIYGKTTEELGSLPTPHPESGKQLAALGYVAAFTAPLLSIFLGAWPAALASGNDTLPTVAWMPGLVGLLIFPLSATAIKAMMEGEAGRRNLRYDPQIFSGRAETPAPPVED